MENPSIKEQIAAQNIINQMSNPTPPGPVSEPPTSNICPQCGTMHPPLQAGEKCPMAII
jgi:rubrerythrin